MLLRVHQLLLSSVCLACFCCERWSIRKVSTHFKHVTATCSSANSCLLLFEQIRLDVFQHGHQPLLHLGLCNRHLFARVSPDCHALTLLHIFRTHFHTDGNPLNEAHWIGLLFPTQLTAGVRQHWITASTLNVRHFSDLEFPVVELPPWRVVVSEVGLHPDTSCLQSAEVFGAKRQQCVLILLGKGGRDSTGDDDNLANPGGKS